MEEIWDSIAESPDEVALLPEAQRAELDRRLAAYEEPDPQADSTWEEVKAELWGQS